jgi:uncharacterized protein (DUF2141 family)
MKTLIKSALVSFGLFLAINNVKGQTTSVQIEISNIRETKGTIYLGFYKPGNDFPSAGKQAIRFMAQPSGKDKMVVTVPNVPEGDYAVAVYQDLNGNGKLDKNFFGRPKEPFAFSRNFHPVMSGPKFDDCKITITAHTSSFAIELIN